MPSFVLFGTNNVGPGNDLTDPDAALDKTDLSALFHDADYDVLLSKGINPYTYTGKEDENFLTSLNDKEPGDYSYANVIGYAGIGLKSFAESMLGNKYQEKLTYEDKKEFLTKKYGQAYWDKLDSHGYRQYSEGKHFQYFNHTHQVPATSNMKYRKIKVMRPPIKKGQIEGPGVMSVDNHGGILPYDQHYYNLLPLNSNVGKMDRPRQVVRTSDSSIKSIQPEHMIISPKTSVAWTGGNKLTFVNDNRLPHQQRELVVVSRSKPVRYKSKRKFYKRGQTLKAMIKYAQSKLPRYSLSNSRIADKRTAFILRRASKKILNKR